jgi:predicted 2-oxoglutarate/Fe(II)-dependent dioxygenase YbiX
MTREPLGIGERAPDFVLRGVSGLPERFYAHAGGRPTAVVFAFGDDPALAQLVAALSGRDDVAVCCVTPDDLVDGAAIPSWWDPDGKVRDSYGVRPSLEPHVVVFDSDLRAVGAAAGGTMAAEVAALLDAALLEAAGGRVTAQAPVLFVPRVLDAGQCERLIATWESSDPVETGVARTSGDALDPAYKQRRDHTVDDPELTRELSAVIGRRVMPEVQKAFAFRATRFEGFKIACYDAGAGFFRAHRDNLSRTTAHRVFALTLNLNDGYAGGELRFPEYTRATYRPAAGEALVFSCSHLHEVLDVTEGRRFVLLSFLYADEPS